MNTRKLKKARLSESIEELKNPGRGWYQIHTFSAEKDFSREELRWCLGDGNTLALAFIDIGAYRERALDKTCLSNIDDILDCFEQYGRDVILRIAYDREGRAEEREPYSLSQVVEHLEQLGPVLSRHAEHIFVYQGLLVGSWGEMHSSRFITENRLERLADVLGRYLGGRTFLAVRRPVYWRMLHPDGNLDSYIKMGLFDDGIFGSDTHLGTFGRETAAEAGWGRAWRMEEELDFEEKLCVTAPQGGEALYEEGQAEKRSLAGTVERLKKMRISYLNCVYDRRILELWQHMTWEEKGPWNGVNGFDYIGRHLGYRFCVRSAKMTDTGGKRICAMLPAGGGLAGMGRWPGTNLPEGSGAGTGQDPAGRDQDGNLYHRFRGRGIPSLCRTQKRRTGYLFCKRSRRRERSPSREGGITVSVPRIVLPAGSVFSFANWISCPV